MIWVLIEYVLDDALFSPSNPSGASVEDWFRAEPRLIELAARYLKNRFRLDKVAMEAWDLINLKRIALWAV